jgi:hypothetical protein
MHYAGLTLRCYRDREWGGGLQGSGSGRRPPREALLGPRPPGRSLSRRTCRASSAPARGQEHRPRPPRHAKEAGERRRVVDPGRRPPDLAGRSLPPPVTAGHVGGEVGGRERGVKETRTGPLWGSRRRWPPPPRDDGDGGRRGPERRGELGDGAVAPRVARWEGARGSCFFIRIYKVDDFSFLPSKQNNLE